MHVLRSMLLLAPLAAASLAAATAPGVTSAVQVTANPSPVRAHSSPQLAVNPKHGELVLVEADVRGSERCNVHISTDDGRSWFGGGELMVEPYTDCSLLAEYGPYASLVFGRDGVLYVAFFASEHLDRARDDTPRHLFLARSSDGGRSFTTTMAFEAPDGNKDIGFNKGPVLAVDPTDSARVYLGWRQGVFRGGREKLKSVVITSGDGARTFSRPVDLTDERGGDYPGLTVDSGGTVHAVYWTRTFPPVPFGDPNAPVSPIYYLRSTDHAENLSERVEIDPGNQETERPPLIAADLTSDALYVAWHSHAEPNNTAPDFKGDFDIFLRHSRDGGDNWSERIILNDEGNSGANQYLPGIAIGSDGRVDVAWYDDRLSPSAPDTGFQDVFATWSTDRGRTFAPNIRITDRSMNRNIGVWANNVDSNHNVGLASTEDAAYIAWQDSRNADPLAQPEDIYMAKLVHRGPTTPGGGGGSWVAWSLIGAGAAFVLGGIALLAGVRTARRSR